VHDGCGETAVNVALTDSAELIDTLQVPVPEQPLPDQPSNIAPDAGEAVKVTTAPCEKLDVQVPGQEIPAGLLLTLPVPVPPSDTLRPS
jgi:hypothetical protein